MTNLAGLAYLDATSGPAFGDPYWAPPPARPFIEEVGVDPGKLNIAFTSEAREGLEVHPDCVRAVQDVTKLCADLGHSVEEVPLTPNNQELAKSFYRIWLGGVAWDANHWERRTGHTITAKEVEPLTWALIEKGRQTNAGTYFVWRPSWKRRVPGRIVAHRFQPEL